jgi:hypothetical protein
MGTIAIIAAVFELVDKYGIPLAKRLSQEWASGLKGKEPTLEDIEALKNRVPPPETFFEKP